MDLLPSLGVREGDEQVSVKGNMVSSTLYIFLSPSDRELVEKAYRKVGWGFRSIEEWVRYILLREARKILKDNRT